MYWQCPGDQRTALFRIDVIEIPISDPSKSKIVSSPAVFADSRNRSPWWFMDRRGSR